MAAVAAAVAGRADSFSIQFIIVVGSCSFVSGHIAYTLLVLATDLHNLN